MRVVSSDGHRALCRGRNGEAWLSLALVDDVAPGTWVLAFLDAVREVIDAERAAAIDAALDALEAALDGGSADFDAFFPDLAGREPQLPEHLRKPAA